MQEGSTQNSPQTFQDSKDPSPDEELAGILDHLEETHLDADVIEDDNNAVPEWVVKPRISPLNMLPDELISEILIACLDVRPMTSEQRLWFSTLRSVCRRWRSVAFSTPMLWTSVQLQWTGALADLSAYPRRLRDWFDRAGDLPLQLGIFGDTEFPEDAPDLHELILVTTDNRKWDYIAVFTTPVQTHHWLYNHVAAMQPSPWRNVTFMVLIASDANHNELGFFDQIACQVPVLRHLVIITLDPAHSFKARVTHSTLLILQITAMHALHCTLSPTLLTAFHHLSTLHLDGHLPFTPPPSQERVTHERLRALIVCGDARGALDYFSFPALRRLVFKQRRNTPFLPTAVLDEEFLLSFIARSQCQLRVLALHWLSFTEQGLSKVLRSLPHPAALEFLTASSPSFVRHLNYKWDSTSGRLDTPDLLLLAGMSNIFVYGQEPTVDDYDLLVHYWNERCTQLKAIGPSEQGLRASPWPPNVTLRLMPTLGASSFEEPITNWTPEAPPDGEDDSESVLTLALHASSEPNSPFETHLCAPIWDLDT
ncbi:hypothetical protein BKA70DRAFT_1262411 [Coprinopsis sp. MPI-PUGE-AT-0042]|nr:hypothetical protein BKA70DRAFT_1262411 [Coprinopsis sp. MPI-PUGE-AT-0042]